MKEKILISIIIILIFLIIGINFNFFKKTKNIENPKVLGAQSIEIEKYSLAKNIKKIPQKKESYQELTNIYANRYFLLDLNSSLVLANKNEHESVPVASTTKLMTAIVALENYQLDEIVKVSQRSTEVYPTNVGLWPDEEIKVIDLLYCLLINSGNDSAYALADHMGFETFINKMNEKAKYLGLKNTEFKDPAGLDDNGRSTAHDLAFIISYALKNDTIKEIISTKKTTVYSADKQKNYNLNNSNRLIKQEENLYYANSIGGKTGYTPDAGHCLASASIKDDNILIAIVLDTYEHSATASAEESKKLFEWGFNNYQWQ